MLEQSGRKVVVQSNELIEASYSLTLNSKRLLLLAISKINPNSFPSKNSLLSFTISSTDFRAAYGDSPNIYRDIKNGAKDLASKSVTFRGKGTNYKTLNWTDSVEYKENQGAVTISFGFSISHHLLNMVEQFTQYDLLSVGKLNSIYSVRLYELLTQFKSTGFRVETLENLRFSLDVRYKKYSDLDRFVIKKAIEELNAKTTFRITYEPVKTGRAVTAIKFHFRQQNQMDMFKS